MRRFRLPLALAALVPAAALALTGCGSDGKASASKDACPHGKIRFGVEPFEDAAKLTPAYKTLGSALQAKLGCPVEVQIVQGYSAEVLAMQNKKLEIAQFGPLGYVFAAQRAGAEAVASFGNPDKTVSSYKAGIWVKKDSPLASLTDLKGHTLALSDTGSTSGDALPRYALKKAGLGAGDVKLQYAGGHPQSLLALTNGKVDAAEINTQQQATSTKEGQFDPAKFKQIWASDPIPNDPITVSKDLDPAFRAKLVAALTSLSPQDVAKVGSYLDVEPGPLVPVTKQNYQPLFDLAQSLGLTEKDV
ncbi:phosphate/phosphite/phosphonate ABC transporter substrate-binding protein [Actinomadura parmotrematis]|uniref:Phosphate/phosphite/phosphonate ABC transporter substrate-binding protein n=1 Tax=Actinomadura parmotrematis TaxID=2864039 RepID=A0ABS7FQU7_9ACTN|nr:phosphate/phosphite/phosphonate ABC transporter substrate-binding protein [Actinomadura parmotrematis]MBW8482731.1 phosphate/phosphite/phosphonate ABC transporter substrate-binding protein [Actinomadura parmotrematis]